jgi:hypothetical protein
VHANRIQLNSKEDPKAGTEILTLQPFHVILLKITNQVKC